MDNRGFSIISLVEYIEQHLEAELSLDLISQRWGYSRYHLHRLFGHLAGIPLMSYVRKRRLARSLMLLKDSSLNIIDIALLLGFEYEQSFIYAFRKEFGITPSRYRRCGQMMEITPKNTLHDRELMEAGLMLPPSQVFLPTLQLIGMTRRVDEHDPEYLDLPNQTGLKFFQQDSRKIEGEVDRSVYYARVDYVTPNKQTCDYTPSLVCGNLHSYPNHLCCYTLPANSYVQFKYIGRHSPHAIDMHALMGIYQYVFENFSEYLQKQCDPAFKLERVAINICRDDYCEMDFLYPLKAKAPSQDTR